MDWMKRAWRGEEKLWKVFWIYGLVFGIILGIISFAVKALLGNAAGLAFMIVQLAYGIFLAVAQWRCAFNAEWKIWGYVVRILVIVGIIFQVIALVMGAFFSSDAGKHAASSSAFGTAFKAGLECAKATQDYQKNGGTDPKTFQQKCINDKLHNLNQPTATPNSGLNTPSVPAAAPATVTAPDPSQYRQACEQSMSDYAKKSGADPQKYIDANQAYLQQCINYYIHKTAVGKSQ